MGLYHVQGHAGPILILCSFPSTQTWEPLLLSPLVGSLPKTQEQLRYTWNRTHKRRVCCCLPVLVVECRWLVQKWVSLELQEPQSSGLLERWVLWLGYGTMEKLWWRVLDVERWKKSRGKQMSGVPLMTSFFFLVSWEINRGFIGMDKEERYGCTGTPK